MPSTVLPAASSALSDISSSDEQKLCYIELPNLKPTWPVVSALGHTRTHRDLAVDYLIDSWSKVKPGDLLTDNRGVIEEVLKLTPIPDTSPVRYRVSLRRGDGEAGFSTVTETHDDRDFTVRRGLIVVARHTEAGGDGTSETSAGISPGNLRRAAADRLLDSLANRSLAFCDHAVARFDEGRQDDALRDLRHYQGLLKRFKTMLDEYDYSSYQALSILTTLVRGDERGAAPVFTSEETPFSLGTKVVNALYQTDCQETTLIEGLLNATARISDAWQALRVMRTESWAIRGDDYGTEARSVIPAVSTSLYRGKAPPELVEALSRAIQGEHRALDSEGAVRRGVICDNFSPADLNNALRRGAHLLVSYNSFDPGKIEGFMLYYPPKANLPEKLQVLRDEHPNLSAAVVDLVYVAPDAPKQTFNHLFWGHRIALQATSDAKIHVGELMMQNLPSYTALVRRGAFPEPEAEQRGEGWQIMTVAIDVHLIKWDELPQASDLIANRANRIPELLNRSKGDTTPAALAEKVAQMGIDLHVHIPDWIGELDAKAQGAFIDCLRTGMAGFAGLVTGPMQAHLTTADGVTRLVQQDNGASVLHALATGLDSAHVVGLFPYPRKSASYRTHDVAEGAVASLGYPLAGSESGADVVVCDPAVTNRIKISVDETADLRSNGEKTALDFSEELERRALIRGERRVNLLLVPEDAIGDVPEFQKWAHHALHSEAFQIALVRSEASISNAAPPPVMGKGIHLIHGPEQLRELIVTLHS